MCLFCFLVLTQRVSECLECLPYASLRLLWGCFNLLWSSSPFFIRQKCKENLQKRQGLSSQVRPRKRWATMEKHLKKGSPCKWKKARSSKKNKERKFSVASFFSRIHFGNRRQTCPVQQAEKSCFEVTSKSLFYALPGYFLKTASKDSYPPEGSFSSLSLQTTKWVSMTGWKYSVLTKWPFLWTYSSSPFLNLLKLPFLNSEETQSWIKQIRSTFGLKWAAKTLKPKKRELKCI